MAGDLIHRVPLGHDQSDRSTITTPVRVPVCLPDQSYEALVGPDLISAAGSLWLPRNRQRGVLITNSTVCRLYAERCVDGLRNVGWEIVMLVVPDGEASKTLQQAAVLYDGCLDAGLDRGSCVFALGGGVVGDLAGFVAGTYMRGLSFVQIPTTLLAQVDASVGGKTAVDLPRGKNLVGVFHQPQCVIADTACLQTLSTRDLVAGMAEVIKHAIIADAPLFGYLNSASAELLRVDVMALRQVVARNIQIKAEVVQADPLERGLRACLNYGHTIGHALEAAAGEWALRHGEAVAYGMIAEARLAVRLGLADEAVALAQERLLHAYGLGQGHPPVDLQRAHEALLHDKKLRDGRITLPLIPQIGEFVLHQDVPLEALSQVLREWPAAG